MINELKEIFGPKVTAIKVNDKLSDFFINIPLRKMKFCEAVNYSFNVPLQISNQNLICPGARRCLGYDTDDQQLAALIAQNNTIPQNFVEEALLDIPKLNGIRYVNVGMTDYMEKGVEPDLFIVYLKPATITTLMHALAKMGNKLSIKPYSLLSVCGNVFSNCYINGEVTLSFGCPESRKFGGVNSNEVVLGLPYNVAGQLLELW